MNNNQKGFTALLVFGVMVAVVLLGYLIMAKKGLFQPKKEEVGYGQYKMQYKEAYEGVPAINDKSDLDTASKSLDTTNTNQVDVEINQITSESSAF